MIRLANGVGESGERCCVWWWTTIEALVVVGGGDGGGWFGPNSLGVGCSVFVSEKIE